MNLLNARMQVYQRKIDSAVVALAQVAEAMEQANEERQLLLAVLRSAERFRQFHDEAPSEESECSDHVSALDQLRLDVAKARELVGPDEE